MALEWLCRKDSRRCLALLLLMAGCAAIAGAQAVPKLQSSPSPRLIILPAQAIADAQATLAVLDSQGRLLPNVVVELSQGQKVTTDATGRALFHASEESGTLTAKISGSGITASTPVVAAKNASTQSPAESSLGGAQVVSYPRVLAIHDRFTMAGTGFRGVADANRVYLADDPCLVLASSPVSLVVLPGSRVPIGAVHLRVTVAGHDAGQFPVSVVLLDFSGPEDGANAGASGKLVLRAHGTTERLIVEVHNGSPKVIQLPKGNVQRLQTSGGGQNIAPVEMKFVTAGNYAISAKLISADANLPDLELARKRLMDARKIASGDWLARIDRVLLKINQAPQDLTQIRADLKSLLDDKPAASLASLLDSAWRELN